MLSSITQVGGKTLTTIEAIAKVQFLVMVFVVIVGVFLRYVFNTSLTWGHELARFLMIWVSCLGGVIIMEEHIKIELLRNALPPSAQKCFRITADILVLLFLIIFLVAGIPFTLKALEVSTATIPHVSKFWVYLAYPCFGFPAMVMVARRLVKEFLEKR